MVHDGQMREREEREASASLVSSYKEKEKK